MVAQNHEYGELARLLRRITAEDGPSRAEAARDLSLMVDRNAPAALAALIRMAEGRRRKWLARYDPSDQLAGIDALGRTASREALNYLENLKRYTGRYVESCTGLACGADHRSQWAAIRYEFPYARAGLAGRLDYEGPRFSPGDPPPRLCDADHAWLQSQNPYHCAIDEALKRLREALGISAARRTDDADAAQRQGAPRG